MRHYGLQSDNIVTLTEPPYQCHPSAANLCCANRLSDTHHRASGACTARVECLLIKTTEHEFFCVRFHVVINVRVSGGNRLTPVSLPLQRPLTAESANATVNTDPVRLRLFLNPFNILKINVRHNTGPVFSIREQRRGHPGRVVSVAVVCSFQGEFPPDEAELMNRAVISTIDKSNCHVWW